MKHHYCLRGLIVIVTLLMSQSLAQAENWYVRLNGGMGIGPQIESRAPDGEKIFIDGESGGVRMGAIGARIGRSFSVEAEISWRSNDMNEIASNVPGVEPLRAKGSFENLAFMLNGRYDIPASFLPMPAAVKPFVLGGYGISLVSGKASASLFDAENNLIVASIFDEDDTVFAYQAGAGISYVVTPGIEIEVSYRFFGTVDPDMNLIGDDETTNIHHNGLVGLTYSF